MNEKEQKVLELKAAIFDVIRKQELFQNEINNLQQTKQQLAQKLIEVEKELTKEMVKNQDFDLKGVPVQEVKE
jgi:hypothetical protein